MPRDTCLVMSGYLQVRPWLLVLYVLPSEGRYCRGEARWRAVLC